MIWIWAGFIAFVLAMLALDLGVFHRQAHEVRPREALGWSAVWIGLGLAFAVFVYFGYEHGWLGLGAAVDPVDGRLNEGRSAAIKYLTGYVVEKSLSVDNVFVIAMLFGFFGVPAMYQHRVLFWGILGALLMRGAMIAAGAALIKRFDWIIYIFGALLIVTAIKMLLSRDETIHPEKNIFLRMARRFFPVSTHYDGKNFFTQIDGMRAITPLFMVLIVVESTDVLFAVDSIPAIFAVTRDPFVVFTSNVFAILGLRSLYFALAGVIHKFHYLKYGLAVILSFVGVKMLLGHTPFAIPIGISLAVVAFVLAMSVMASLIWPIKDVIKK